MVSCTKARIGEMRGARSNKLKFMNLWLANLSWILLILVCPLSMVLMMASMQSKDKSDHKEDK